MALPDSAKVIFGTPIVLADTTDHSPATANNLGTRTDQIDCTDLAAGAARQSAKFDLGGGTANMDLWYNLAGCVEWETTPEIAASEIIDFYIGFSNNATAGTANPGGLSGSDAAYTGYSGGTLAESVKALTHIGGWSQDNVINTDAAQINMNIGSFQAEHRYAILVVYNRAASAALHSDMIETSFVITPKETQIQD